MGHADRFLSLAAEACRRLDAAAVDGLAEDLRTVRERQGRLFVIGVGGSAANCSHAVNDFRKLCGIEAYTPVDNVAELTARTNDEGWDTVFAEWLKVSRGGKSDALLVFSVGGGDVQRNVSVNLITAIKEAKARGMRVFAIVGRAEGYAAQNADRAVVVPVVDPGLVTPIAEAFQAVVWHALVSHPALQVKSTKW